MRAFRLAGAGMLVLALLTPTASAVSVKRKKQLARQQFDTAERLREALNGRPAAERTEREYQKVIDAYRRVYYVAPTSNKADASVVAVAELLAESGRSFSDDKTLRAAIAQYEFLRREYPGSKYRFQALFTMGQISKDDLEDVTAARAAFEEFLKRYPHHQLAEQARAAIAELERPAKPKEEKARKIDATAEKKAMGTPLVTGIRHWSTPDYTRVAIDLEAEVRYDAERIPNPDRIYFDLHHTKLSSTLVGKTFDVEDGFLHKVRVAQYQRGETRVVLEVDEVADYSAFLLPNPYRLVVDIHGKKPQKAATAKPAVDKSAPAKSEAVPKPETAKRESEPAREVAESKPPDLPKSEIKVSSRESKLPAMAADLPKVKISDTEPNSPAAAAVKTAKIEHETARAKAEVPLPQPKSKRGKKNKKAAETLAREARPAANGERSLIRALGLKIGRIVVDAGHGGHDTGTIGPNGLMEKDLVLDVAHRLGKLLEIRLGAEVVYTRDDDTFVPLETRTALANQNQADLFVSIHANSSPDPSARGVETYYLNFTSNAEALEVAARENAVSDKSIHELQDLVKKIALKEKIEESREFAIDVQRALHSGLASRNSGLRDRGVKKAPFIVLIGANMPSILAEISFVSNPSDAKRLNTPEWRQRVAESLYRGIAKYASGLSGVKVASKLHEPESQ